MKAREKTVCLLSYFFSPIFPGYGTRCPAMIGDVLLRMGYRVKVITAMPPLNYRHDEKYKRRLYTIENTSGNLTLYRFWTPEMPQRNIAKKIAVYLWFLFISHLGLLFIGEIDALIRVGPYPPLILFPEFLFGKIKNVPLLLHLGDLWPDVLFTFVNIRSRLAKKLLLMVSILSYRLAWGIIAITSSIKDGITGYEINESKVFVVELGVDCDIFKPNDKTHSLGLLPRGKFIVMYSGNFGPAYDFDTLLRAAKHVGEVNRDILFVIRGSGALESFIHKRIAELKLSNVLTLGVVNDLSELIQLLNSADIFVLPMSNVKVQETAHPSKVFEYLACGKPVVCCADGELRDLIIKSRLGSVVSPGDAMALAEAITGLYEDAETRITIGKNARKIAENRFSYTAMGEKLGAVITLAITEEQKIGVHIKSRP